MVGVCLERGIEEGRYSHRSPTGVPGIAFADAMGSLRVKACVRLMVGTDILKLGSRGLDGMGSEYPDRRTKGTFIQLGVRGTGKLCGVSGRNNVGNQNAQKFSRNIFIFILFI